MLTQRYLASSKNIPAIMNKIISGIAPDRFTTDHLKNIGFGSSTDRAIIPLLKDLGFLSADGIPTSRYHAYRNHSRSKKIMAEALHEAYTELFHINAKLTKNDKDAIKGVFKSTHNGSDRVAELQTTTFFTLLELADLEDTNPPQATVSTPPQTEEPRPERPQTQSSTPSQFNLRYNIEVHLPATKDIEVYNAIFKSLKENLVD